MADFVAYIPKLKRWEGGFVDDPDDKGGATNCGVTIGTFRTYFGRNSTVEDLKNMTEGQWRIIMRRYWDRCKADQIENQSIAEIFVDWHVNAGTSAIRKVQSVFGLKVDGIVGGQTLRALNGGNPEVVFNRIKSARISYYNKLAANNASYRKFLRGWLNRTESFTFK